MIQSITFGDKNTWDDWHILPKERPVFAPPAVKTHYIDIPGGNGSLDLTESLTGYPVYENRKGSFTFRVMNDYGYWADRYSEIMNHLHGKRMNAVLADDDRWFYRGRFTVDDWKSADTWSEITIGYEVEPFKWSIKSSTDDWLWDPFNFKNGVINDVAFSGITIDNSSSWTEKKLPYSNADGRFNSEQWFGTVPIAPNITVSNAPLTGIDIRFVNSALNIDKTINFKNGTSFAPDFIFYGQKEPYSIYFKGAGTVSIDFRVGRL